MKNEKTIQKILRFKEVVAITGLSRSTILNYMKTGDFPLSVKIGKRNIGWIESEIQEWIECCMGMR